MATYAEVLRMTVAERGIVGQSELGGYQAEAINVQRMEFNFVGGLR